MPTTKLFVGNITRGADVAELRQQFEQFGTVAECDIISDYGFVHFNDSDEADAALAGLHGFLFHDQKLKVEKSTSYVRRRAGDGNMSSETCYVCGKSGHWAKNCSQVPEHEREKQIRRADSRGRGGPYRGGREEGRGPPPRGRYPSDDYYDDRDDYPPRRRRPPPPSYYDEYDDYDLYYRRRPPPPRYYDPYDDYDYLPPRRLPAPPGYYRDRERDLYPPPPRRAPLPPDDYPPPRAPVAEYEREREAAPAPRSMVAAAAAPAPATYYDFTEDTVDKARAVKDIDPLAELRRESAHLADLEAYRRIPRPY